MEGNFRMRTVILYIAMSLDGYIADSRGQVDWLTGHNSQEETADSYSDFVRTVDTVVMGWNTYRQITEELSPDEWVYSDLTSYIITHRNLPAKDKITFVSDDPCKVIDRLKAQQGASIWVCGGGQIVQPLVARNLIDEYHIAIIPTLLGSGIRLFGENFGEIPLKLLRTQSSNGITELVYRRR